MTEAEAPESLPKNIVVTRDSSAWVEGVFTGSKVIIDMLNAFHVRPNSSWMEDLDRVGTLNLGADKELQKRFLEMTPQCGFGPVGD